MTPNPLTELLSSLGIGRSHSRPQVSYDNPHPEAQCTTLEHCPFFAERVFCTWDTPSLPEAFFASCNHEHRHSGIGDHTPASVHYGTAEGVRTQRAATLAAANTPQPDLVPRSAAGAAEAPHRGADQRPQRGGHTKGSEERVPTCLAGSAPIMQAVDVEQLGGADEVLVARFTPGSPGTSPSSSPSRCAPASKPIACIAA
jgi:hypothetical protein